MKVENLNMTKCFHFNPLVHYISTKVVTSFHRRVVPNSASDLCKYTINFCACMYGSDITQREKSVLK